MLCGRELPSGRGVPSRACEALMVVDRSTGPRHFPHGGITDIPPSHLNVDRPSPVAE
jgi:hypothetical protein